jgi:hypothetical protein
MPFHLINSSPTKYSSIESQKRHEYEYKKFLKSLNHNSSEQIKYRPIDLNNNYLIQRQINLQYQRKHEYERIQNENFKFSQRLMNAKAFLNRHEQQIFFDKHCKLKQRLQHYPDLTQNQTKKLTPMNHLKIINKPIDSSFFIYNDNPKSQKKLPSLLRKAPDISTIQAQQPSKLPIRSPNIIDWNKSIRFSSINYLYKAPR